MNRLGNAVRAAVAAAVFVLPVAAATVQTNAPVTDTTTEADGGCCTGTPWGEMGGPPVVGDA